jgi:hypothetical protein
VTYIFLITPFIMDFSQLSEENQDIELFKVFAKIDKIVSQKELKKRIPCYLILLIHLRIN